MKKRKSILILFNIIGILIIAYCFLWISSAVYYAAHQEKSNEGSPCEELLYKSNTEIETYIEIEDMHIIPSDIKHPDGGIYYELYIYIDMDLNPTNGYINKIKMSDKNCIIWNELTIDTELK